MSISVGRKVREWTNHDFLLQAIKPRIQLAKAKKGMNSGVVSRSKAKLKDSEQLDKIFMYVSPFLIFFPLAAICRQVLAYSCKFPSS